MPLFEYHAINQEGKNISGRYNAKNRHEIIQMLRSKKYYPVRINEVSADTDLSNIKLFNKIKTKDIAVFARQFYAMLHAGVTVIQCLNILRVQVDKPHFRSVIDKVYESVQKGVIIRSNAGTPEYLPELFVNMIEAGEASGNLDNIMIVWLPIMKESRIQRKIRAMTYPIILAVVSV